MTAAISLLQIFSLYVHPSIHPSIHSILGSSNAAKVIEDATLPLLCVVSVLVLLCLCHQTVLVKALRAHAVRPPCIEPFSAMYRAIVLRVQSHSFIRFFRPFVCPFVRTDRVTTISRELLEQSWWNLHGITTTSYWWPGWILEVKVTAGCRGS